MKTRISATLVLLGFVFLTACGGGNDDDSSQNEDVNLSGTWRQTQVYRYHSLETNEYLYSDFTETTLIITEGLNEISYSSCVEHGIYSHFAIKTDNHFYLNKGTTAFTRNVDGSYSTKEEMNIQYSWMTTTYINYHTTLSKISDDVIVDKGLLILTGPVAVTEYNHVCLSRQYSNISDWEIFDITVPYDDRYLYLRLELMSKPVVGPVNYIQNTQGASISGFEIISPATGFNTIVGSNMLDINAADFNITESSNSILSGTYSFVANTEIYDGEFQIELNN